MLAEGDVRLQPVSFNSALLARAGRLAGYCLFFAMLFIPAAYQPVKGGLLWLTLIACLVTFWVHRRIPLDPVVRLWPVIMAAGGLFFIFVGLQNGAPGALRVGTVYVIWPLLYTALVAASSSMTVLINLARVIVIAAIAISTYAMTYILNTAGVLPGFLYVPLDLGQNIGFYQGFVEFNLYSLSSLLFCLPFLFAALTVWPRKLHPPVCRTWLWIALALASMVILLSGRRGLWVVLATTPVLTFALRAFLPQEARYYTRKSAWWTLILALVGIAIVFLMISNAFDLNISAMWDQIAQAWDANTSADATLGRKEQLDALLYGWSLHPFIGAGHGAAAPFVVRSTEMPWAYELSYFALLYQTGILGFSLYLAGIIWIYYRSIRIIQQGGRLALLLIPVLCGLTCFLFANATNPYLSKFDYLWVVFLPVAFINYHLVQRKGGNA